MFSNNDYMELGPTPSGEKCVQVEPSGAYVSPMRAECKRFIEMLEKVFPQIQEVSAYFKIKANPHDFGTYYEAVICYEIGTRGEAFAYFVEANIPEFWSETAPKYFIDEEPAIPIDDFIEEEAKNESRE